MKKSKISSHTVVKKTFMISTVVCHAYIYSYIAIYYMYYLNSIQLYVAGIYALQIYLLCKMSGNLRIK